MFMFLLVVLFLVVSAEAVGWAGRETLGEGLAPFLPNEIIIEIMKVSGFGVFACLNGLMRFDDSLLRETITRHMTLVEAKFTEFVSLFRFESFDLVGGATVFRDGGSMVDFMIEARSVLEGYEPYDFILSFFDFLSRVRSVASDGGMVLGGGEYIKSFFGRSTNSSGMIPSNGSCFACMFPYKFAVFSPVLIGRFPRCFKPLSLIIPMVVRSGQIHSRFNVVITRKDGTCGDIKTVLGPGGGVVTKFRMTGRMSMCNRDFDLMHIESSSAGSACFTGVLRYLLLNPDTRVGGLCGDESEFDPFEFLDAEQDLRSFVDAMSIIDGEPSSKGKPKEIDIREELSGFVPKGLGTGSVLGNDEKKGLGEITECRETARPPGHTSFGSTRSRDSEEMRERRISEDVESLRDDNRYLRESIDSMRKDIGRQIREGVESLLPGDSASLKGGDEGPSYKGKGKLQMIDDMLPQNKDLETKIDMMRSYIDKLNEPRLGYVEYQRAGGSDKKTLGPNIDIMTVFSNTHSSYTKEDYESDLLIAHENSGIKVIDGEFTVPKPPKTYSHTMIPKITCDDWLNFLIRLHMALFLLLGTDPYPPTDFIYKFKRLHEGKYDGVHPSMDLLHVVMDNTMDFKRMIVKSNNFCFPIIEPRMKINEMIIASCLISLLSDYKSRWAHLFKDCVVPSFVQRNKKWEDMVKNDRTKGGKSSGEGGESSREGRRSHR